MAEPCYYYLLQFFNMAILKKNVCYIYIYTTYIFFSYLYNCNDDSSIIFLIIACLMYYCF